MSFRRSIYERPFYVRDGPYSTDGSCGPAHGNTICDPNSQVYKGGCCSVCLLPSCVFCANEYSNTVGVETRLGKSDTWPHMTLTKTISHCGTGCFSGCTATTVIPPATGDGGQCGAVSSPLCSDLSCAENSRHSAELHATPKEHSEAAAHNTGKGPHDPRSSRLTYA